MSSIQANFQPVKFAIVKWHADLSPRLETVDDATLKQSIRWSFALNVTPLKRDDTKVLDAQLSLRLQGKWKDADVDEVLDDTTQPITPFAFEAIIVGIFSYQLPEEETLQDAVETFDTFLKRNGAAYLYSTLRPVVRNFFLTSVGKQILLPAVNMHQAFKSHQISTDEWIAHYNEEKPKP